MIKTMVSADALRSAHRGSEAGADYRGLPRSLIADIERLTNRDGYINAGIPRFEYLFGRDSIISALQLLPIDPGVARSTLTELAARQGTKPDRETNEEPGKILHECYGNGADRAFMEYKAELGWLKPGKPVYFSVDSTPLFLILFSEYYSLTRDRSVFELMPKVDAAVRWILDYGMDGGLVRYGKPGEGKGLQSQSWKDGIGRLLDEAVGPVAVVEVQGYAYHALVSLSSLVYDSRNPMLAARMRSAAATLRERLNDFWMPKEGSYALAIDGNGRRIESVASNPGHLLFTGILDRDRADSVVSRLFKPDMLTPYGIRTHSMLDPAFDERDYQLGTVWPHDNGIIAWGLKRRGYADEYGAVGNSVINAYKETGTAPEYNGVSSENRLMDPGELRVEPCTIQGWTAATLANLFAGMQQA